jgi:hypothetical protein
MPSPGHCVSAGKLVLNYGATNMAPTLKDTPLLSSKGRPNLQTHTRSWNEHKLGRGSRRGSKPKTSVLAKTNKSFWTRKNWMVLDGARNQERLCWWGPAAIYWTGVFFSRPTPIWRTKRPFVWSLHIDLSSMGKPNRGLRSQKHNSAGDRCTQISLPRRCSKSGWGCRRTEERSSVLQEAEVLAGP